MKKISPFLPLLLLFALEILIFGTNYTADTRLIGWDVVTPEFNFPIHVMRSVVGVWQENRGLGLYDGMSHISNLLHTLTLWLMSFVLPQHLLRYSFIFLCHYLGGVGMYILLYKLFDTTTHHHPKAIALTGAIFYLINLITVQMFFTPLEAFSVHFASLPWIAFSLLTFIEHGDRRSFLLFALICVLVTPQYFITTLLLPISILIASICIVAYLRHRNRIIFRHIALVVVTFFAINAFWILPYIKGLPSNASVIASAKINLMSSEEIFARNKSYGDIESTLLLRGFPLSFEDQTKDRTFGLMMEPWKNHIETPPVLMISSLFIGLVLAGFVSSFKKKHRILLPFTLTAIIGLLLLGNNIPVFATPALWLREHIPFFSEAYRFAFTKFSILFVFSYTILLLCGLIEILRELQRYAKYVTTLVVGGTIIVMLWSSAPIFTGNFLYTQMRISLPTDYSQTFEFFSQQDPNKRIALLPQPTFWSWKYFSFGLRGSGFFWQGVSQPTMDRAFDPWSKTSENYYWELSKSLYSKDRNGLASVLTKYDISYVVLDEYLASSSNDKSLFIDDTKSLLSQMPEIRYITSFGKISIYENTGIHSKDFVGVYESLPSVFPKYTWSDTDTAYNELGNYISVTNRSEADITYTFPSLFTKRSSIEREFTITEDTENIVLSSQTVATHSAIHKESEVVYDSKLTTDLDATHVSKCALVKTGTARAKNQIELDNKYVQFSSINQRGCLSFDIADLPHQQGYLFAVDSRHVSGRPLSLSIINLTAKHIETEVYLPMSKDWNTSYYILPPLAHDGLGYSVYVYNDSIGTIESVNHIKNIRIYKISYEEMAHSRTGKTDQIGEVLISAKEHFSVDHPNPSLYVVKLNTDGSPIKSGMTSTLVLSQSFDDGWKAYSMPNSKSQIPSIKKIQELFPFLFGTEIKDHVLVNNWANGFLLRPEEFGTSADKGTQTIILFFWPQLLQWFGFLLLPIPFIFALRIQKRT